MENFNIYIWIAALLISIASALFSYYSNSILQRRNLWLARRLDAFTEFLTTMELFVNNGNILNNKILNQQNLEENQEKLNILFPKLIESILWLKLSVFTLCSSEEIESRIALVNGAEELSKCKKGDNYTLGEFSTLLNNFKKLLIRNFRKDAGLNPTSLLD